MVFLRASIFSVCRNQNAFVIFQCQLNICILCRHALSIVNLQLQSAERVGNKIYRDKDGLFVCCGGFVHFLLSVFEPDEDTFLIFLVYSKSYNTEEDNT